MHPNVVGMRAINDSEKFRAMMRRISRKIDTAEKGKSQRNNYARVVCKGVSVRLRVDTLFKMKIQYIVN